MDITKFVLNETSYFGEGARSVLQEEINKRGFKKDLVVTDKSLYEVGVSKKVTDLLDENNIEYGVFHEVLPLSLIHIYTNASKRTFKWNL